MAVIIPNIVPVVMKLHYAIRRKVKGLKTERASDSTEEPAKKVKQYRSPSPYPRGARKSYPNCVQVATEKACKPKGQRASGSKLDPSKDAGLYRCPSPYPGSCHEDSDGEPDEGPDQEPVEDADEELEVKFEANFNKPPRADSKPEKSKSDPARPTSSSTKSSCSSGKKIHPISGVRVPSWWSRSSEDTLHGRENSQNKPKQRSKNDGMEWRLLHKYEIDDFKKEIKQLKKQVQKKDEQNKKLTKLVDEFSVREEREITLEQLMQLEPAWRRRGV